MRLVKRAIPVLVVIFIVMACIPMSAFATGDVVQFTEAAKLGASIVDLYGMANNTSLAYDVASNQSALTVIENLYTEYSSNASDPYTLAAIGAAAAAAGAIAVIYDAVTGQGYIQLYQEQYISSLDGYWDYQLADAGLVRDSLTDLFNWTLNQQDTVTPIQVAFISSFGSPLPYASYNSTADASKFNNSKVCIVSDSGTSYGFINSSNQNPVYVYLVRGSSNQVYWTANVYYVGDYNVLCSGITRQGNPYYYDNLSTVLSWNDARYGSLYYGTSGNFIAIGNDSQVNIPVYDTYEEGLIAFSSGSGDSVSIEPYWGDPLNQPLEITIPDNTDPSYTPVPRRITTTMPVPEGVEIPLPEGVETPEYGVPYPITDPATLNAIVPELWDNLVADDVDLRDDPEPTPDPGPAPDPSEVFVPLLPVTLPSFNFNFSGIWHYVRDWVSSLGAWFTLVFTIWSNLPYAIVVPVYATAVIVIVLGVYKRFFM